MRVITISRSHHIEQALPSTASRSIPRPAAVWRCWTWTFSETHAEHARHRGSARCRPRGRYHRDGPSPVHRPSPLQGLGRLRGSAKLNNEQRDTHVLLHRDRTFLKVLLRGTLPVQKLASPGYGLYPFGYRSQLLPNPRDNAPPSSTLISTSH